MTISDQRDLCDEQWVAVRLGEDRERSETGLRNVMILVFHGAELVDEEQLTGEEHRN
jgi:hypothetical protein